MINNFTKKGQKVSEFSTEQVLEYLQSNLIKDYAHGTIAIQLKDPKDEKLEKPKDAKVDDKNLNLKKTEDDKKK